MIDADSNEAPRLGRGVRVRMSALGRERHPKYGNREGLIVGRGSPSSWRIKFDDRVTVQAIHQDYLEAVPRLPSATGPARPIKSAPRVAVTQVKPAMCHRGPS